MPKNTNNKEAQYMNYQEYFNNYLGAWSFANGDEVLTISGVSEETMYDAQTGSQKSGLCIRFAEKALPMVLNKTNAAMIAQVTGTNYMHDWIGKQIVVGTEKGRFFGKVAEAIRVRDTKPAPATPAEPKLSQTQKETILALVADGRVNLPAMLEFYDVGTLDDLTESAAAKIIKKKGGAE
jgi:hypothetical protein